MLAPEDRHLLTDALRPPPGFRVDAAVATTYTLDLFSLLLAPLAMAAYDHTEGDASALDAATPLTLLESVRRHAEHTVVLCQAAGMHVPPSYPRLAAFAEGIVTEVLPPPGATFHPKIWVLRFVDAAGTQHHRFVCLSRNLTGDRSWDTILVCDEDASASALLDAAPVATFVQELLSMTTRPLTAERRALVDDLCRTVATAPLGVPAPFGRAEALPLGTPSGGSWPLPERAESWLVVSPFLTAGAVRQLPRASGRRVLLSRADSLEQVGREACAGIDTRVLQAMADAGDVDELLDDGDGAQHVVTTVPARGLHAKIFCWDDGKQAHVVTGSANCTGAAFGGNIEMSVVLSGPRHACGPDAVLGDDKRGLAHLTQAYEITAAEPNQDEVCDVERQMEQWQAALAEAGPTLVATQAGDSYDVALRLTLPHDPDGLASVTTVRPLGLVNAQPLPVDSAPSWRGAALHALCPYLAVTTSVSLDGEELLRECVILVEVEGAPTDRLRILLREMLADPAKVLAYLALLLGDLGAEDLLRRSADLPDGDKSPGSAGGPGFDDLVLLEPLLRAAARDDDALERVQRLLEDLRGDDGSPPPLDEDFMSLWQIIREATQS